MSIDKPTVFKYQMYLCQFHRDTWTSTRTAQFLPLRRREDISKRCEKCTAYHQPAKFIAVWYDKIVTNPQTG